MQLLTGGADGHLKRWLWSAAVSPGDNASEGSVRETKHFVAPGDSLRSIATKYVEEGLLKGIPQLICSYVLSVHLLSLSFFFLWAPLQVWFFGAQHHEVEQADFGPGHVFRHVHCRGPSVQSGLCTTFMRTSGLRTRTLR